VDVLAVDPAFPDVETTVDAPQDRVVSTFAAVPADTVAVHEPHVLRGDRAIGIEPLRLELESEAGKMERGDPIGRRLGQSAADEEPLRAAREGGAQNLGLLAEDRRDRRGYGSTQIVLFAIRHLSGDRVERAELDGRREDGAAAIADDSALRGQHQIAAHL